MLESLYFLIPLFFLTAFVYSTVGFGGGSTYLAILVLFTFPYQTIPKVALICNLVVAAGGCYFFYRAGYFNLKKSLPFIMTSIPCAYLGGKIPISKEIFTFLLAISLIIAAGRMLFSSNDFRIRSKITWGKAWAVGLPIGALLGILSGLVGIGGGIFLLPILYLLGWAHAKEAAAITSLFILVNSIAGLMGQFSKGIEISNLTIMLPLVFAVFLGGQIGSRLGSGHVFSKLSLQRISGCLILFVSLRLFWEIL